MINKLKSKKVIIVSIMIMLTSVLMLSYASFVVTTNDYKASELLVSELTYSLTIYDENNNIVENPIVIGANTTKIYNVVITSINKIDSKYTLAYNSQDNLTVKYSNRTSWSTEDYIKDYNSNNTKEVRIVVENKSNETRNVEIKIFGGYRYNDYIKIDTKGYTRITEEYDEELLASSEVLNEIIKEETKCNSSTCLYGGGNKSNYLSYSNNLYRIIGTYTIGTDKVTKIISENITTSSSIKEDLNSIYNSLEEKEEIIYKTNKFNCNENTCNETEYSNIGLLTKYEYETIGGENSYLKSNEGYYVLNENNIETQNGSETGGIKPVIYLPEYTKVTGSGTISDPYIIKNKFIVTYNSNGGETLNPGSKEVTHLKTYGDLPTPTRVGHTFNGWFTEINGGSQITKDTQVTNNNDHTIYARWTANQLTVTYDVNGGNALNPGSNIVTYLGTYGSLPTPTRTGYTFNGWYTATSGGSKVTEDTEVMSTSNHSIYAHWTPETYTITYNLNSGSISGQKTSYTIETATFTLPTPTRDGYTFTGWTGSNGSTVQTSVTISKGTTGNKTYTANWKQNKVTFTMNSSSCPDKVNNNSSACYVIRHITDGDDKTATYNSKTYTNCTIVSSTMKYDYDQDGTCETTFTDVSKLSGFGDSGYSNWFSSYWNGYYGIVVRASCSVTIACDPA